MNKTEKNSGGHPRASHAKSSFGEPQPPLHEADFGGFAEGDTLELFLLAGQSNMKGRAPISMTPEENGSILFFHSKQLDWYTARDPLHAQGVPDMIDNSDNAGTGPGMSFAQSLAAHNPQLKIGLIPAAVGGAPIALFGPDGELFNRSLMLTKKAVERAPVTTRLRAVLWLQGESDAVRDRYTDYERNLLDLVDRYRGSLNRPDLPFIACTIGSFMHKGEFLYGKEINDVLLSLPQKRERTACIDARDLAGHVGDGMHYSYESQLEIGKRFASAYLQTVR